MAYSKTQTSPGVKTVASVSINSGQTSKPDTSIQVYGLKKLLKQPK